MQAAGSVGFSSHTLPRVLAWRAPFFVGGWLAFMGPVTLLFPCLFFKGDERTEALRDALRNEGSINKGFAEELDTLLAVSKN